MAGVLSPNDVRREQGWPASTDPTADSIEPPVVGGKAADPLPPAPTGESDKIAVLGDRRARPGGD